MGLAERRAAKQFQDGKYVQLKKQLDEAAGYELTVEVDWNSLAAESYASAYDETFSPLYFEPVIEAIQAVCVDEMGREALKAALKKIVVRNSGTKDLSFQDGVLVVDHPFQSGDYKEDRIRALQEALEKAL